MNAVIAAAESLLDGPVRAPAAPRARRSGAEVAMLALMAAGVAASLVALLSYTNAVRNQLGPEELYSADVVKDPVYYAAHGAQILLLLAAGVVALLTLDLRLIRRGYLTTFLLFCGAAVLMAARGYSVSDLLSTRLVDATGPFPCLISVLIFAGAVRANWRWLGGLMQVLAVVLSALTVAGIARLGTFTRQEAVVSLGGILNALYWPAVWLVFRGAPRRSAWSSVRWVPIILYAAGSLLTQTRLNFVMLAAFLALHAYLLRRRNEPQGARWIAGIALAVWLGLFSAVFLSDTPIFARTWEVGAAFYGRLDEDTRTGQLVHFFQSVRPRELVLGRGSLATWDWHGINWRGGTDVGYLTLLFYGGIPLLATYVLAHVTPCLAVLRAEVSPWRLASAAVVLLWSLRMLSSSYPGLGLGYYPVLWCVGACILRDTRRREDCGPFIGTY